MRLPLLDHRHHRDHLPALRRVRIYGDPEFHRAKRLDDDPRLVWTVCGVRFCYDPDGYERAMAVTKMQRPYRKCLICFPKIGG